MEQFVRNLRRGVGNAYTKSMMRKYGELAIKFIVARTRKGIGVSKTAGSEKRLKALSASYIKHRQRNTGKLDSTTSPRRSNLTFTGQMLRSMRVKEVSKRQVKWGPNKVRRKGGITNEKVGEFVAQQGRPFNFLSKVDIKKLIKFIDKSLQGSIRKV
jgi:hypothetical protein